MQWSRMGSESRLRFSFKRSPILVWSKADIKVKDQLCHGGAEYQEGERFADTVVSTYIVV